MTKENNYDFRERLLEVHKKNRRLNFTAKDNQTEIDGSWSITVPSADRVLYNAARDLADYFAVSMNIYLPVIIGNENKEKSICYSVDTGLGKNKYRIQVTQNRVLLSGGSARDATQAGYHIEDLMNLEEGPYLELQSSEFCPIYEMRMSHSGYGLDLFPDEYLKALAHTGTNTILIFVRGLNENSIGPMDFNDVIYRAEGYGLDTYVYSLLKNMVYPEGEEGLEFYRRLYGDLFRMCPGFKGVVLVGESCEFRSRDERTSRMMRLENRNPDGSRIVADKPNPGWFPCYDYPLLLNMIKTAVREVREDAEIVFWTYNWGKQEEAARLELIRNVPKDITLEVTFEMFELIEREGVLDRIADYSLYFEGAGKYFISEAKEAKKQGLRLYSMTNTGGATWDFGVIPYVPAPQQWLRRYEQMRKYHDECGLCGIMESHHFGTTPSFITDFSKWMFHSPDSNPNEILRKIAVRDFSNETADSILEAWNCYSEGIRHTVTNNDDQYGPYRIGPAYPLLFKKNYTIPSAPHVRFGNNKICRPLYKYPLYTNNGQNRIEHEIRYNEKAMEFYDKGADIIESVIPQIHPSKRDDAMRLAYLGRFMARSAQTTVNTKKWFIAKEANDYSEMLKIAKAEIENAKATIPLVEADSRLGYEPSMDYMCDRKHIEWKIAVTNEVIDQEIKPLME